MSTDAFLCKSVQHVCPLSTLKCTKVEDGRKPLQIGDSKVHVAYEVTDEYGRTLGRVVSASQPGKRPEWYAISKAGRVSSHQLLTRADAQEVLRIMWWASALSNHSIPVIERV